MKGFRIAVLGVMGAATVLATAIVATPESPPPVSAQGVGRASWTPAESTTEIIDSRFLRPGDAITYRTDDTWDREQNLGLKRYVDGGLRYTHEVNDRSGRLHATGYWASNYPDPAFDRDDDDGDGRWEEAEIIAGAQLPEPGVTYSSFVQFSRWHPKRQKGRCVWAWDRRKGNGEVLSQLSRDLLGEWQAERFTLTYDTLAYPRVDTRPSIPEGGLVARCRERRPQQGQSGYVVTFREPLRWSEFRALPDAIDGHWTAFEAVGTSELDDLPWTCGGPVDVGASLQPCRAMGVRPDGVSAAVGYLAGSALDTLRADPRIARVDDLQDPVTGLLFEVGGFGVERPGLTINDHFWEQHRAS